MNFYRDIDVRFFLGFFLSSRKSILEKMFEREREYFKEDKNATDEFLSVGEQTPKKKHELSELAAYAQVASAIFNLDETITKY